MSQVCLPHEDAPVECGNCGWTGRDLELDPISDFEQRVAAGETCPAGECPRCHALAYLVENEAMHVAEYIDAPDF